MNTAKAFAAVSLSAALITAVPALSTAAVAGSQKVQLISRLVDPAGNPVSDAAAVLDMVRSDKQTVTRQTYKTDPTGKVTISIDASKMATLTPAFYVVSPTGFGLLDLGNASAPGAISPSVLQPFTSLRIRVIDSHGYPAAFVTLCPKTLNGESLYGLSNDPNLSDWVQTTDVNGWATIPRLPQGFKLQLTTTDNSRGIPDPNAYIQLGKSAAPTQTEVQLITIQQLPAPYQEAMAPPHKLR